MAGKQKIHWFYTIHSKSLLDIFCFSTLSSSVVCGCNTSESFLTCCVPPAEREREICDRDATIWMTVKVIHRTHNCKLKGTPRTSNLSISKSTPIVALYVLSNVSLQNLEGRNIKKYNHSSFFFFYTYGWDVQYVKILIFFSKSTMRSEVRINKLALQTLTCLLNRSFQLLHHQQQWPWLHSIWKSRFTIK